MRTLPTSSELLEGFRRAADAAVAGRTRPDGSPYRISWAPTSWPSVVRAGAVRLAMRCLWVIDSRFRASFLDTAEGDDLDAWAASEAPGFPRKPASAARTRLRLVRATQTTAGTIYAGSRFSTVATSTSPAITFASLVDVPVAVGDGLTGFSPIEVDVACETTGESGNVDQNAITRVLSPLFDTFTVHSQAGDERAAGGTARESDAEYRDRLRQRDARYRRGTVQAVTLGAMSVPGVARVSFSDPQTDLYDPATNPLGLRDGTFRLVVGDARGIGSQPLADLVSDAMREWAAEGVSWEVYPAGIETVLESYAIDGADSPVPANTARLLFTVTRARSASVFDAASAERAIRRALTALSERLEHRQPLHMAQLKAAVLATNPTALRNVTITAYDAGGTSLGAVTNDWGAPIYVQNRWDIADSIVRVAFVTE